MDPSGAHHHHHQEMANQTLESMLVCTKTQQQEKKPRPQPEQALKCPRCDSTNTKFCYYNNYSLTQPRYFCKSCRRYWTKGGTLRNVPVGGGCRKNKRSSSKRSQDQSLTANHSPLSGTLPSLAYDSSDLSLAFARLVHHKQPNGHLGFDDHDQISMLGNHNTTTTTPCDVFGNYHSAQSSATSTPSFLDALRGGYVEAPNGGFHNLYYGMGNNGNYIGHLESGGVGVNEEMGISYEDRMSGPTTPAATVTAVKQELGREGENRVLWGFPWQLGGDGNMGDHHHLDASGRESWNGIGSSWHGLLNSPLM